MAKRPRDPIQLAKQVFDIAVGEAEDTVSDSRGSPPANEGPQNAADYASDGSRTDRSRLVA